MSLEFAKELAAQAWCQPKTKKIIVNPHLAEEFAIILNQVIDESCLGCATTGELIDELRARCEINGTIDYKTVSDL